MADDLPNDRPGQGPLPRAVPRSFGRRLAGILPPPRDEALVRFGRAARDLVLGRVAPAASPSRSPSRIEADLRRIERAAAMLERGDPGGALAQLEPVLVARPDDRRAIELRRTALHSGQIRGRSAERAALEEDVRAALRHLAGVEQRRPILLAYHPPSPGNPFQALLYSKAFEYGVVPLPLHRFEDLDALAPLRPLGGDGEGVGDGNGDGVRVVLHLHWLNRVLHGATTAEEAGPRIATFLTGLDRFLASGGRLVWTVHNVLPHDCVLPAEEALLRREIVARATVVHFLAAETAEAVAANFVVPAGKVLHVPHPGFQGTYEDIVEGDAARFALGLDRDELVYALLGGLKPYKGLADLLDAWKLLPHDGPRRRLLVAGAPDRSPEAERFLERAAADPRISLHARTIPAADMQLFLRAADVVVLPYQRTLNSAVLLLALTFGVPVIAPATTGISGIVTPAMSRTFVSGDRDSLLTALLAADQLRNPVARAAARQIADAHDPAVLSERFMRGLVAALDAPVGAA